MARTIQSPGVEIKERDLSDHASLPIGTNVLVHGFAADGPTSELLNITTKSELRKIYGDPTNPAERYFYTTCAEVLNSPANLLATRLPYGSGTGSGYGTKYSALLYPVSAGKKIELSDNSTNINTVSTSNTLHTVVSSQGDGVDSHLGSGLIAQYLSGHSLSGGATYWTLVSGWEIQHQAQQPFSTSTAYIIGEPYHTEISEQSYHELNQQAISWTISAGQPVMSSHPEFNVGLSGNAGFIVVNDMKTTINENGEGYYIGISDSSLEGNKVTSPNHDAILNVKRITSTAGVYADVNTSNISFALSSTFNNDSISEDLEGTPNFDFGNVDYDDEIILATVKLRPSLFDANNNIMDKVIEEVYIGSFNEDKTELNQSGGEQSAFIENKANKERSRIKVFVNPNFANSNWETNSIRVVKDNLVEANPWSSVNSILSSYAYPISGGGTYDLGEGTTSSISGLGVTLAGAGKPIPGIHSTNYGGIDYGVKSLYPLGSYTSSRSNNTNKTVGNLVSKLDNALLLANNREEVPIDIVTDGGLSTIATVVDINTDGDSSGTFDDETDMSTEITALENRDTGATSTAALNWRTIYNIFETFCKTTRRDCIYIADAFRHIFVRGRDAKTIDNPSKNFSSNIYAPLKNLVSASNSNYTTTYGNWGKGVDPISGKPIWVPLSGYIAAIMARLDSNKQPWFAPAGYNNGILRNLLDIGFNPNQKERDLLYVSSINPVLFSPGDGFVVLGQKTLQAKPSAFDRINVRRLFLVLEKATLAITKYFVMEQNTAFTRTRLVNVLKPIFEVAKNNEGVYDYLIVCDERNNTSDTIDNNELIVDIYIKPVKVSEFILVNFIATRTGQDFEELI